MSGANELLDAISVLQSGEESNGLGSMRSLGSILGTANGSLGQAWFNTHAAFSQTQSVVDAILKGVYNSTQAFAQATVANEKMATDTATNFNEVSDTYYTALSGIGEKYGVSSHD